MNMATRTKAIYEEGILKPLEKLDLKEGEEVEIELKKSITERTLGIIQLLFLQSLYLRRFSILFPN